MTVSPPSDAEPTTEADNNGEPPADTRPRIPIPRRIKHTEAMLVGLLLLLLVVHQFGPIWTSLDQTILGDEETDAIKGMWSFDHIRRSILPPETPIWSSQANYPEGVLALALPWVSAVILSPLGGLFGPIAGFNLSVVILVWALGMATAWLAHVTTRSWAAGAVAGAVVVSQPMLMHAIGDGTPEHISLWTIPVFLVAAWKALSKDIPAWGVAAGLSATLVALDSPYNAVYTMVVGVIVLPFALLRRREGPWFRQLAWTLGLFVISAAVGAMLIWLLYRNFPLDETTQQVSLQKTADPGCKQAVADYTARGAVCLDLYHDEMTFSHQCRDEIRKFCSMNTTDIRTWQQFDANTTATRDPSLAPTLIPKSVMLPLFILGLIGAPRALPWLFAGSLMVILSLNLNGKNPQYLQDWLGTSGLTLGEQILSINAWLGDLPGIKKIRFPHRWLVPGALCLAVAGAHGLARLFKWLQSPPLVRHVEPRFPQLVDQIRKIPSLVPKGVIAAVVVGLSMDLHDSSVAASRVRQGFPMHVLTDMEFTQWVRDQPGDGAFALIPESQPPPISKDGRGPMQEDLPVFADLDDRLSGSDQEFIQVLIGRPTLYSPDFQTFKEMAKPGEKGTMMGMWNHLGNKDEEGNSDPPSSLTDPRHVADRQRVITELRKAGLRFLIVDTEWCGEEGMTILTNMLEQHTLGIYEFNDGTGVTVFELGER